MDFQICAIIGLVGSLPPGAQDTTQEIRVCLVTFVAAETETPRQRRQHGGLLLLSEGERGNLEP